MRFSARSLLIVLNGVLIVCGSTVYKLKDELWLLAFYEQSP